MRCLFDEKAGMKARDTGMERAAKSKREALSIARTIALDIARSDPDKTCDADRVQAHMSMMGIELGNAAGSIFKADCWEWTGKFINSRRVSRHRNVVRLWKLTD